MVGLGPDLYVFAKETMFQVALVVFVFGVVYRVFRFLLFWRRVVKAQARNRGAGQRILGLFKTFIDPILEAFRHQPLEGLVSLLALHIIGLIPLIFLMDQHIESFNEILPKIGGLSYSILAPLSVPLGLTEAVTSVQQGLTITSAWGPLIIVLNGDVLATLVLIAIGYKVGLRLVERAHGLQYIRIGDFLALILLAGIILFGFTAAHHLWSGSGYWTALGLHILLAEILLMVLPFTKFWYFVFGYWYGKLHEWYDLRVTRGAT